MQYRWVVPCHRSDHFFYEMLWCSHMPAQADERYTGQRQVLCSVATASALQLGLALSGMNMGHLALLGFTPGILLCSGCKWEAGCSLRKEIDKVEIVPSVDQEVLDFSVWFSSI